MDKETTLGLIFIGILIMIIPFLVPIHIKNNNCYTAIAIKQCGNNTLNLYNYDTLTTNNFRCCDYSFVNNESRRAIDREPICEYYSFVEKDHQECSKRYQFWRETE